MKDNTTERNAQSLVEKLIGCADEAAERFRAKRGENLKLPGYVRLMYSAAKVIQEQDELIQEKDRQLDKAMAVLQKAATCKTCKHGDSKKCHIRSECGVNHSLWEFDAE